MSGLIIDNAQDVDGVITSIADSNAIVKISPEISRKASFIGYSVIESWKKVKSIAENDPRADLSLTEVLGNSSGPMQFKTINGGYITIGYSIRHHAPEKVTDELSNILHPNDDIGDDITPANCPSLYMQIAVTLHDVDGTVKDITPTKPYLKAIVCAEDLERAVALQEMLCGVRRFICRKYRNTDSKGKAYFSVGKRYKILEGETFFIEKTEYVDFVGNANAMDVVNAELKNIISAQTRSAADLVKF